MPLWVRHRKRRTFGLIGARLLSGALASALASSVACVVASAVAGATLDELATPEDILGNGRLSAPLSEPSSQEPLTEADLRARLASNPTDAQTLGALAGQLLQRGALAEGRDVLERYVAVAPADTNAGLMLAQVIGQLDGPGAMRARLIALLDSASDPFPFQRALIQLTFAQGARAEARQGLVELLAQDMSLERAQDTRLALARVLMAEGAGQEALAQVELVLAITPDHADALAFRGLARLNGLDLFGALRDVTAGLAAHPDHVALLRVGARAEWRAGNRAQATRYMVRAAEASEMAPEMVLQAVSVLQEQGQDQQALALMERALGATSPNRPASPQMIARLGALYLGAQNWDGAAATAAALRRLGTEDSRRISEQIRLAVLQGRGETDAAQAVLSDLARSGRDLTAVSQVVNTHLANGAPDVAMAFIQGLLRDAPESAGLLLIRAALHDLEGARGAAEQDFRTAARLEPQNPAAHVALARHFTGEDRPLEAEAALLVGMSHLPDNADIRLMLSEVLAQRGDITQALSHLEYLLGTYPDNLVVANNYVAFVTDRLDGNPDQLRRALAVAGQLGAAPHPRMRDTYGWLLHKLGEHEAALQVLGGVLSEVPGDVWANYHAGMVLLALSQPEAAVPHLQHALEGTDPSFDKAELVRAELARINGG